MPQELNFGLRIYWRPEKTNPGLIGDQEAGRGKIRQREVGKTKGDRK